MTFNYVIVPLRDLQFYFVVSLPWCALRSQQNVRTDKSLFVYIPICWVNTKLIYCKLITFSWKWKYANPCQARQYGNTQTLAKPAYSLSGYKNSLAIYLGNSFVGGGNLICVKDNIFPPPPIFLQISPKCPPFLPVLMIKLTKHISIILGTAESGFHQKHIFCCSTTIYYCMD